MKYNSTPSAGLEFFELLNGNAEFNEELGRCILASSRLEAALFKLLLNNGETPNKTASLGLLIKHAKDKDLLPTNIITALQMIKEQRNYMTHNIYRLFSNLIEETLLPRANLLNSDVATYIDYALQLRINLEHLGSILLNEEPQLQSTKDI